MAYRTVRDYNRIARGSLEKSPSLKRELSEMAVESYGDAVLSAAREKSFPSEMPWALADTLRDDFILD
ncbi:DUF29 family protein [Salmonella enterica]|nr:DUF29 family protein [Salmonella enterica]ELD8972059.1 DUF29 family protein [Salmonella enterica]ELT1240390.1 DUF29 family protein [Salmonella enterica]